MYISTYCPFSAVNFSHTDMIVTGFAYNSSVNCHPLDTSKPKQFWLLV